MPYLTPSEINSHLYGEIVQEIERSQDQKPLLQQAINAGIAEVKGYLTQFDVAAIFAATGDDRNPIILLYTKDIAVWHYIQLANPNVELDLRKVRYETATKYLDKVQSGKVVPDLPHRESDQNGTGNTIIKWGSNPKRNNHF
jgi:phage gp36-like protein